ncbi:MAG TPA: hypothetical protein VN517_03880 [Terriglobales bacterium]|nr:hypothetical protein [Terriglobales bacterium]
MTTPAAERLYLAQHLAAVEGRGYAVFNPHNKPLEELPVIYGFNNGGSSGWYSAVALAEDGTCLGGHCCSDEGYMPCDLGVLEGTRTDRHANEYQKHYPGGYRMDFVPRDEVKAHEALNRAFLLNQEQAAIAAEKEKVTR